MVGDRPCKQEPCQNRHLSHVAIFHRKGHKSQERWSEVSKKNPKATYIGFHITSPEAVASIVHSEFRCSKSGMLGAGVYFARSIDSAVYKAVGGKGAYIIAEIRMGRVYEFNRELAYITSGFKRPDNNELETFVKCSKWHADYDTCYMNHPDETKDEFCIKDPHKQIIKWVVVIEKGHDTKVEEYELDTEFDSTKCFCI